MTLDEPINATISDWSAMKIASRCVSAITDGVIKFNGHGFFSNRITIQH